MVSEEELCAEHLPWVVRYSRNFARRQLIDQYADCESDAQLAMLMAIRSYDPEQAYPLDKWISYNVFHGMVDGIRTRLGRDRVKYRPERIQFNNPLDLHMEMPGAHGGQGSVLHERIPAPLPGDLTEFERVELLLDLSRIVPGLSHKQRAVIGAVYFDGLSQAEHSARRGVTESATTHLLKHALKKIKNTYTSV